MLIPDDDLPRQEIGPGPGAGLSQDANAQELGGNIGQAAEVGAEVAARVNYNNNQRRQVDWEKQQEVQKQADGIAAQDAANKVEAWHQGALYGSPAPSFKGSRGTRGFGDDGTAPAPSQPGILTQQTGADAPAVAQKALGDFDKQASQARADLNNDQQKQFFDHMTAIQRAHMQDHLDEYVGKQLHLHAANVQDNTVDLSMNAIGSNPADYPAQVAKMQASTQSYGKFMGWDADTMQKNVGAVASQGYLSAIRAFNDQSNPEAAQAVLDAHRAEITDPRALQEADATTKAGVLASTAQTLIGSRLHVADDTAPGGSRFTTKDEFLSTIDSDKDLKAQPELLNKVRAGGLQQIKQHEEAENDKHDSNYQAAIKALNDGVPVTDPAWNANVESLPKPLQDAVWNHADRLTDQHIKMVTTERQHEAYGDFFIRDAQDPAFLRRFTGAQMQATYGQGQLSPEGYDKALEAWKRAKGPAGAYQADGTGPNPSEWQDVSDAATRAGLDLTETGKFSAAAQDAICEAQDANKDKPLAPEKRQQIIAQTMAEKVFVPNPARGRFDPSLIWDELKERLGGDAPNDGGRTVPTSALSDEDWSRIPQSAKVALAQRHAPWSLDAFRAVTATKPKDGK